MKPRNLICILLFGIIFCSCEPAPKYTKLNPPIKEEPITNPMEDPLLYQTFIIDSCEYILGREEGPYNGGYALAHKGNCKFCKERGKHGVAF